MKNIVLTGFMASGKTITGKEISRLMGFEFLDIDEEIEKNEGQTINDIFKNFGEEYFRNVESRISKQCSTLEDTVISCGGGTVLRTENIENLRKNGVIFNLNPTEEVIAKRLFSAAATRPLMRNDSIEGVLKRFYDRKPYYDNCDYKIEITSKKNVTDIANEIISLYKKGGD